MVWRQAATYAIKALLRCFLGWTLSLTSLQRSPVPAAQQTLHSLWLLCGGTGRPLSASCTTCLPCSQCPGPALPAGGSMSVNHAKMRQAYGEGVGMAEVMK